MYGGQTSGRTPYQIAISNGRTETADTIKNAVIADRLLKLKLKDYGVPRCEHVEWLLPNSDPLFSGILNTTEQITRLKNWYINEKNVLEEKVNRLKRVLDKR